MVSLTDCVRVASEVCAFNTAAGISFTVSFIILITFRLWLLER